MFQVSSRLSSVTADGGSAMTAAMVAPQGAGPSARLVNRRLALAPAQAHTARAGHPGVQRNDHQTICKPHRKKRFRRLSCQQ